MAALKTTTCPVRIGITQRRWPAGVHSNAHDGLDTGWSDWFDQHWHGTQFLAIPNFQDSARVVPYFEGWGLQGLVLSGGGDVRDEPRLAVETALLDHAKAEQLPVLGICRGMQMLHCYSDGELATVPGHVGQIHSVRVCADSYETNSWHELGIRQLAPGWRELATALDGSVEAMQHAELPWLGLMWHPERANGAMPLALDWIQRNFKRVFT